MLDKPRGALRDTADSLRDTGETLAEEWDAFWWLVRTALIAAVIGALLTELRKPPGQRTWHGRLIGFVPYDFRPPSFAQFRDAYWNPSSDRLFTDRPLGVGWAVNVPVLLRRVGLADRLPLPGVRRGTSRRDQA